MKYKVNHFSYIRLFRLENIWTIIVLLLFIKPQIADDIGILDLFFNVGRVGVSFIYLFMLIVNRKKINKTWLCLVIIFFINFGMTVLNQGILSKSIAKYLPSIGLLSYILYKRNKLNDIFRILIKLDLVILIFNLVSFIIFPGGIVYREASSVPVWILGQKQDLAGFIFPMLFIIVLMYWKQDEYKKILLFAYGISIVTVLVEKSIAAFLCIAVLGCLFVWDRFIANKIKKIWLIFALVLMFIIIQYIAYNFDHMYFIQKVLLRINTGSTITKVRTLGTRFLMWKFAWNKFFEFPLFGSGELSQEIWIQGAGFYHSVLDNMYMDIILGSGLMGSILFLWILRKSFKLIDSYKTARCARWLNYILFIICIYIFTGSPFFPMIFLIFASGAWIPYMRMQN